MNDLAVWATVIGTVTGGAIGVGGTIFGVRINQSAEDRRWSAEQAASRQNQRADRLRTIYARIIDAAIAIETVNAERSVLFGGETVEERDARHTKMVRDAVERAGEVGRAVLIEASAIEVVGKYRELVEAAGWLVQIESFPPGKNRDEGLARVSKEIPELSSELQRLAREQMTDFDKPAELS